MRKRTPTLRRAAALLQAAALVAYGGAFSPSLAQVKVAAPQVSGGQSGSAGAAVGSGGAGMSMQVPQSLQAPLGGSGAFGVLSSPQPLAAGGPSVTAGMNTAAPALPVSIVAPQAKTAAGAVPVLKAPRTGAPTLKTRPTAAATAEKKGASGPVAVAEDHGRETNTSALKGLLKHGPQAGEIGSIEGVGEAHGAAESSFMKAAGLGGVHQSQGRVAPRATGFKAFLRRVMLRRSAGAQEAASEAQAQPGPEASYKEITLDNGMKVQLVSDPGLFSASIAVGYEVGARDEVPGESGYAHFLEHLMFQGTTRIKNWFRMVGAMGGFTNAWTYPDRTMYVHTMPMNLLELGISLEAERMLNLEITDGKVNRERRVILEEKAGRDNSPMESGWKTLQETMFGNPKNQGDVIGTEEDIKGATAEKLQRYYDTYYTPGNARVVISGNIDLTQTEAWVREHFGTLPTKDGKISRPDLSEKEQKAEKREEVQDAFVAQPAVLFGWQAPNHGESDYYAAGVLAEMLQERLHRRLVLAEKGALSAAVSMPVLEKDPVAITGSIAFGPETKEADILKALNEEIEAVRRGDFTQEEVALHAGKIVRALDSQLGDSYSSTLLLTQAAVLGMNAKDLDADINRWTKVKAKDVKRAARKLLSDKRRSVVSVKPAKKAAEPKPFEHKHEPAGVQTPTAEEEQILSALSDLEWFPVNFQAPEEFTLPNGLKVIVMPDNRRSTVYAKLAFRLGESASNPDVREKVPFAANLMRLRTAGYSETQIEDILIQAGARIQTDQRWDHMVFDGNAPAEQAGTLLSLLAEMMVRPHAWTEEELAAWKDLWKASLKESDNDPNVASHQRAIRDLLGNHPSARASITPEAIDSMTPEELARLALTHFAPDNAVLVVAGDVNPEWVRASAAQVFEGWKPSKKKPGKAAKAAVRDQGSVSLVDRPGSQQAFLRVSGIGLGDGGPGSKDFYPLLVADQVMGGGWGSRLYQVARQAMGVAYNAFSTLVRDPAVAMWTFGLSTQPGKVREALGALLEQAKVMRDTEPSEVEMASAKNSLVGSFLLSLDYIGDIADNLLGLELFGRPLDSMGEYLQGVSSVTPGEVRKVSQKLLDPRKLSVTVVGDAEEIGEAVSKGQSRPVNAGPGTEDQEGRKSWWKGFSSRK